MQMVKLIRFQGGIAGVTSQGMADVMALDGGKYGKGILDSCRVQVHHADGGIGGPADPRKAESHRGGDPDDYPVPPGRRAAVHWAQPCTYRNPRLPQGVRGHYHLSHRSAGKAETGGGIKTKDGIAPVLSLAFYR